ncbi:MAG TPA: response regulator, partial [Clostridia bacterium]|nr:response regulator [Clostridia bacterium]
MYSILIVEDELLVRLGLQAMAQWEKDRFAVAACVGDGQAALEAWRQYRPDIVITDIIMPGLSGLELMRAIRQEGGKCPFIVITAFSHKQALNCAEELSICACLEKSTMTQRDVNSALMLACSKVQEALPEPRKP